MRRASPSRAMWIALLSLLAVLVVAGHVALWTSEETAAFKWRLTILNALGWAVMLGPALFVNRWLSSMQKRNADAATRGGDGN